MSIVKITRRKMDAPYTCRAVDGIKQHSLFQTLNNVQNRLNNDSERAQPHARDHWRIPPLPRNRHQVCSSLARLLTFLGRGRRQSRIRLNYSAISSFPMADSDTRKAMSFKLAWHLALCGMFLIVCKKITILLHTEGKRGLSGISSK